LITQLPNHLYKEYYRPCYHNVTEVMKLDLPPMLKVDYSKFQSEGYKLYVNPFRKYDRLLNDKKSK
jgi:hypothetical protein